MNAFFGIISPKGVSGIEKVTQRLEQISGGRVFTLEDPTKSFQCCYTQKGVVLGIAKDKNGFLLFLGTFHMPLPGWTGMGSPMDDANKTAAFLLKQFRKKGASFLDGLVGQYAIAVGDFKERDFWIGSDPSGGRRLFVYKDDESLIFSTQLALFNDFDSKRFYIDRSNEDFFLSYEFVPQNETIYKNITFLKPGTLIRSKKHVVEEFSIAKPDFISGLAEADLHDEASAIDSLHDVFMQCIEELSPTSDGVAVLLGGFDSALVASALVRLGKRVETFSFHFEQPDYNQALTDTLARNLNITHHWSPITPDVLKEGLDTYRYGFNQPVSLAHYVIHSAFNCANARYNGYHWAIGGDGCDEIFLGYPTVYRRAVVFQKLGVMPAWLVDGLLKSSDFRVFDKHMGHPFRVSRNVLNNLKREMPARGHITNRILDNSTLSRLRLEAPPPQKYEVEKTLEKLATEVADLSPLRLAYHGKAAPGLTRCKNEGNSAQIGISIQSPYQHPRLKQFGSCLPDEFSRPTVQSESTKTGKYLLMKMAEKFRLLPREIIYQKKASPVTAPVDYWYMGPLYQFVLGSLKALPFDYDETYVKDLLRPKFAEAFYRRYLTMGKYTLLPISLLLTYASFSQCRGTAENQPDAKNVDKDF
jgi:asparagine synthetase B (glutamine-hydrolysing)